MIVTMMRMMKVATTTLIITIVGSEEGVAISVFVTFAVAFTSLFVVVVVDTFITAREVVGGSGVVGGSVVGGGVVGGGIDVGGSGLGVLGSDCVVVGGGVMMVSGGQVEPLA